MRHRLATRVVILMAIGLGACGVGGGATSVFDLEVGDCFNDPENLAEVVSVQVVACTEPHDNEVSDLPQYPADAGAPYPGDAEVDQWAEEACIASFESYVGIPYEESALYVGTISPRAETWADGDREVVCVIYEPGVKLTSSVRGSQR